MNNILITKLNANSSCLEDCKGYFSKYLKAWKMNHMLDAKGYNAEHIKVSAGPHEQIDNLLTWSDGKTTYSIIDKPSKNKRGTLKVTLQYKSKPATIGTAVNDLSKLYTETGIGFGVNLSANIDTKIFTDKWNVSMSSHAPWDESRINIMLESRNSDVTSVKLELVGILDDSEIKNLSNIVDELYLPDYTGYKIKKEFGVTYIDSEYTTKMKFGEKKSNMPKIVVKKRIYGFNESKILEFYNKIISFEKTDYLRPTNSFFDWSQPILNIEVASLVNDKAIYANYLQIDDRGSEYYRIAANNRMKDIVKEKSKKYSI